jgi:hypothetical protein
MDRDGDRPEPGGTQKGELAFLAGLSINAPLRRSAELLGGSARQLEACRRFTRQ